MGGCLSTSSSSRTNNHPSGLESICLSAKDIAEAPSITFTDREHGRMSWKDLVSGDKTSTRELTSGIASCPPKRGSLAADGYHALHRHPQAVMYFFQQGDGVVNIDMIEHEVSQGSVLYVPGNAEHGIRNVNETEKLVWYFCFAADSHRDVKYRYKNDTARGIPSAQPRATYEGRTT